MPSYRFHLVNVFAETPFGGNPLAVFEPADGLDSTTMQAIAAQMNLSETTFVFPATEGGDARVRIFTPGYELPFAGHPVLGTAAVLARLRGLSASVRLEMAAGMFPIVLGEGGYAQLTAKPAQVRPFTGEQDALADMLGLGAGALRDARFVNTGTEQLLIELTSRMRYWPAGRRRPASTHCAAMRPGRRWPMSGMSTARWPRCGCSSPTTAR